MQTTRSSIFLKSFLESVRQVLRRTAAARRGGAVVRRAGLRAVRRAIRTIAGSTQATQLPLSGRTAQTSGSVKTSEAPAPSTTATVNTLSPSVQVQGAYAGSTPGVAKMPFNGKLGLQEAIQRGLAYNLGETGATQALRQAQGQSKVALSSLLPNLNGTINENVQTTDLQGARFPLQFSGVLDSRGDRPFQLHRSSRASFADCFSISRRSTTTARRAMSRMQIAIPRRTRAN